jgi:hypothetical protein
VSPALVAQGPSTDQAWWLERRDVTIRGVRRTLRLARFATGWVASVDTPNGPTLGVDRSPYLAARRALEPLGVGMVEAMTMVGPLTDRPSAR